MLRSTLEWVQLSLWRRSTTKKSTSIDECCIEVMCRSSSCHTWTHLKRCTSKPSSTAASSGLANPRCRSSPSPIARPTQSSWMATTPASTALLSRHQTPFAYLKDTLGTSCGDTLKLASTKWYIYMLKTTLIYVFFSELN